MPEGDAVVRTARRLDRALRGAMLTGSDLRVPRFATTDLSGQTVLGTGTRGKHLLTRTDAGLTLHTHLRMDGSWVTLEPGRRWPKPAHQARAVLETASAQAVGFLLGVVELIRTEDEAATLGHLGPDLLGPDWDETEAVRRLEQHADEPVFDALRDQTSLAGIGTIWAAEACFTRGTHPATPVGEAGDLTRLVRVARLKLQQSVDGARVPMAVYGRERAACRRCGTPVQRIPLGTAEQRPRDAYFCPSCQPLRAGEAGDAG